MNKVISLLSMKNNNIWIIYNDLHCIVIDPGVSEGVLNFINRYQLSLLGILVTHKHLDHINGIIDIIEECNPPIFCSKEVYLNKGKIFKVRDGDVIRLMNLNFNVIALPGHTLHHIGFYSYPMLFCGDVVFSAGCGKVFEGTYNMMYNSLVKIKNLPIDTMIFPAHEYTINNLCFSEKILKSKFIKSYKKKVREYLVKHHTISPTSLLIEFMTNIFLRCNDVSLISYLKLKNFNEYKVFETLRIMKDNFKS